MPQFRIAVALDLPMNAGFTTANLPRLSAAVRSVAELAQAQWKAYAHGAPLPSGQVISPRSGNYARSILLRQTGDFSATVYSTIPYASSIEHGMPERDLKKMLDTSLKVRLTKDGRRYLIVPFRVNTPNSVLGNTMPEVIHNWWKNRLPSAVNGTYRRISGTGAYDIHTRELLTVPGWKYSWGDRLGKAALAEMGIANKEAKRLSNMVMFRKPGGSGGSSHSKFLTFRTMVEGSPKWIAKAVPGKWPAKTVAEQILPIAEETFLKAVQSDLSDIFGSSI